MPEFVTSSERVLQLAFLTGMVTIALAILALFAILAMRTRLVQMQRRRAAFNRQWRPVLAHVALLGSDDPAAALEVPMLRRRDQRFFLEEWNILHDLLSGAAKPRLNELARTLAIDKHAWRRLKRGSLGERLLAVATLGHLRELSAWDVVLRMLRDDNTLVSLVSARALIGIDPAAAIPLVLPVIMERDDWSTARVADLFLEAGPEVVSGPLEQAILSSPPEAVPKLIAVLPEVSLPVSDRIVSQLLRQPTDDRIKSICLRIVENPRELPSVRELTTHARWHVRMTAAIVLGRLGLPEDRAHLVRLLSDSEWWVRYRAAQALLAMPFVPREEVIALQSSAEDPFARDILGHVLAERPA